MVFLLYGDSTRGSPGVPSFVDYFLRVLCKGFLGYGMRLIRDGNRSNL